MLGVGKTSMIRKYIYGEAPGTCASTLGMELESKVIDFPKGHLKLDIWDTVN